MKNIPFDTQYEISVTKGTFYWSNIKHQDYLTHTKTSINLSNNDGDANGNPSVHESKNESFHLSDINFSIGKVS